MFKDGFRERQNCICLIIFNVYNVYITINKVEGVCHWPTVHPAASKLTRIIDSRCRRFISERGLKKRLLWNWRGLICILLQIHIELNNQFHLPTCKPELSTTLKASYYSHTAITSCFPHFQDNLYNYIYNAWYPALFTMFTGPNTDFKFCSWIQTKIYRIWKK